MQILPTVAFFFRTDSTDSPDCLPIGLLLSIPVFYFLVFLFFSPLFGCWFHRRKLLLGPGAQAPHFYDHGARICDEPPHFCDVILSKLCFNCLHWFYAMLTVRPFIPCSARHFKKGAKFAGSVGRLMTKMLPVFRGALPP